MKISVQVKPKARKEGVEKLADGSFVVRVHAPPTEGQANQRVIELLAAHLGVPKSRIVLISGHKSRCKTFAIEFK